MRIFLVCFLLALCKLCVAGTGEDSVFVSETDSSYTLYYQTNGSLRKIYEIRGEDGSEIGYHYCYKNKVLDYDLISLYNNAGPCQQYIFFDRKTKIAYFTKIFFEEFAVDRQSVNFKDRTVILYSYKSAESTADISSSEEKEEVFWRDVFVNYNSKKVYVCLKNNAV